MTSMNRRTFVGGLRPIFVAPRAAEALPRHAVTFAAASS
jgi:hypothetical protein